MQKDFTMDNPGNRTLADYRSLIKAMAVLRVAAAQANCAISRLDANACKTIEQAANAITNGSSERFSHCAAYGAFLAEAAEAVTAEFVKKTGVKESLIALNQSVTDVSATACEIAVREALLALVPAAQELALALEEKSKEFSDIVKCGRIGLQDGLPVRVSDELQSYALSIREATASISQEADKWNVSHFGSGDSGTGFGIDGGFADKATKALSSLLSCNFTRPAAPYHALNQSGKFFSSHNALMELAFALWRIANDLEFLSSGPRGGIRELILPAIAPGSSIMPGKINPTAAELVSATSDRVLADHDALLCGIHRSWGANGTLSGLPVRLVLDDADLLARTCRVFVKKVIQGLSANQENCRREANASLALGLILTRICGPEKADEVMQKAVSEKIGIEEAAVTLKALSEDSAKEIFDLQRLADNAGNAAIINKYAN